MAAASEEAKAALLFLENALTTSLTKEGYAVVVRDPAKETKRYGVGVKFDHKDSVVELSARHDQILVMFKEIIPLELPLSVEFTYNEEEDTIAVLIYVQVTTVKVPDDELVKFLVARAGYKSYLHAVVACKQALG